MHGMKLPDVCPPPHPAEGRTGQRPPISGGLCVAVVIVSVLLGLGGVGLTGCTLRPMHQQSEMQIDSVTMSQEATAGVSGTPFCLHLRHDNEFFVAYSRNKVEAWVTEGRCTDNGPERSVDAIRLNWRADLRDSQEGRQCMQSGRCTHTEQNVIEGKFFRCATAAARHGNQAAYISSDEARCN